MTTILNRHSTVQLLIKIHRKRQCDKIVFNHKSMYLPTKFSKTDDFPADCPPTTAICGKSENNIIQHKMRWNINLNLRKSKVGKHSNYNIPNCMLTPNCVNASWSLFTIGISDSIPWFPALMMSISSAPGAGFYAKWLFQSWIKKIKHLYYK